VHTKSESEIVLLCISIYIHCGYIYREKVNIYIYTRYRKTTTGAGGRKPATARGEHAVCI